MHLALLHQSTANRRDMILNGKLLPTILFLSMPTIMMGTVQSLIPLIDGLFINNMAGTIAASAVTYCTPIIGMTIALAQGLGAAGMAIIGQMNGKGEFVHARYISTQIVVVSVFLSLMVAPLLILMAFPVSHGVDPRISHDVFLYLTLSATIVPFQFLENIYNAIKNASGKPEAPFVRMVLMLIFKVIFSFLFLVFFRWGIVGTVMATLAANLIIGVWMYYEMFVQPGEDRLTLHGYRMDFEVIRELFRIGVPSMFSSLMLNLGFFLINNEVEKYGPIVLNGQGIANNITSICYIVPGSFGSSVTTIVSMNVGAGQGGKARSSCLVGAIVSAVSAVILIAIILPLSPFLTRLFTRQQDVLVIANHALHIYIYAVVGFGVTMTELGAFIGLGRTVVPMIVNILRVWLLRYVFILATERFLSFYAVFWGNLFSNYACAVLSTILVMKVGWTSRIPQKKSPSESDG